MTNVIRLTDFAKPPKPRLVAGSEYLNREPRSIAQVRAERAEQVELPADCEKDFAE